ncbi:uncharacterized protein LOC119607101 [Lucilia sericata]|uniref:uncharacterized protein LOC119607101 n=1 Tax=Lucilia sericata TaxID=13632 RepID=UPI0018A86723|nr:uncharacterized protein LOC119607101 [Lucilia sericata]
MKFLSIKELLAIGEIIVGSLSLYNYFLTDFYDEKLLDLTLFKHRCISVSLSFYCYFNACGTWFWFSNVKITKMLNRVHKVLVYLILNILLIATHFSYKSNYGSLVWGYFDQQIFFDEIERIRRSFYIVLIIMTLSGVIIGFNVNFIRFRVVHLLKKKKRNQV